MKRNFNFIMTPYSKGPAVNQTRITKTTSFIGLPAAITNIFKYYYVLTHLTASAMIPVNYIFVNQSASKPIVYKTNMPTATALLAIPVFLDFMISNLILKFAVRKPNINTKALLIVF
jgi:hypothetical protein